MVVRGNFEMDSSRTGVQQWGWGAENLWLVLNLSEGSKDDNVEPSEENQTQQWVEAVVQHLKLSFPVESLNLILALSRWRAWTVKSTLK